MHWVERVPWERIILGVAIIWGFVAIINFMLTSAIPAANKEIVLSMTAVLGTALGAVVGAVFRQNSDDAKKNDTINTLAQAASAPIVTTTTVEKKDEPSSSTGADQGSAGMAGEERADEPVRPRTDDAFPARPPTDRVG